MFINSPFVERMDTIICICAGRRLHIEIFVIHYLCSDRAIAVCQIHYQLNSSFTMDMFRSWTVCVLLPGSIITCFISRIWRLILNLLPYFLLYTDVQREHVAVSIWVVSLEFWSKLNEWMDYRCTSSYNTKSIIQIPLECKSFFSGLSVA